MLFVCTGGILVFTGKPSCTNMAEESSARGSTTAPRPLSPRKEGRSTQPLNISIRLSGPSRLRWSVDGHLLS